MMGSDDQRPERFTPEWPPKSVQKPLPNIFTRCSDTFKKVTWPPEGYEDDKQIEPPPSHVPLLEDIPLNPTRWIPTGTYKWNEAIYAEEPEELETAWPPPAPIDTSERVIHDPTRAKRAIRDVTVHFKANEPPPNTGYQVPPGTLHVLHSGFGGHGKGPGVLSYNTPDIGSGTVNPKERTTNKPR